MTNVLNFNPYAITGVMAATFKNSTPITPHAGPIFLKEIYWLNPATIGDLFTVTDGNGNVIKAGRCEVAGQSQVFQMYDKQVTDFQVTVLGSGTLYIEHDQ